MHDRPIRSFVKRQGRMTAGQRTALKRLWPRFGLDYAEKMGNLETWFKRPAPVILEIGFGNGDNLLDMAEANPDINFLGIEVHEPGVGHCLLGAEKKQLNNILLVCEDALLILRNMIPDDSISRVNLFFPDPWPKKRHHKRRIVQPKFVELIAKKLQPEGIFHVATDWENYAEHIADLLSQSESFQALPAPPNDRTVSRFDRRGRKLGHSNWEQAWRNTAGSPR